MYNCECKLKTGHVMYKKWISVHVHVYMTILSNYVCLVTNWPLFQLWSAQKYAKSP